MKCLPSDLAHHVKNKHKRHLWGVLATLHWVVFDNLPKLKVDHPKLGQQIHIQRGIERPAKVVDSVGIELETCTVREVKRIIVYQILRNGASLLGNCLIGLSW